MTMVVQLPMVVATWPPHSPLPPDVEQKPAMSSAAWQLHMASPAAQQLPIPALMSPVPALAAF